MTHITLVLPFALPLPEFAADLLRALDTPALAQLLGRAREEARASHASGAALNLPHEQWLAKELGLATQGAEPLLAPACAALRGFGQTSQDGRWLVVNPGHIQIARSHLMMSDPRQLALDDAASRALFETARVLCEDIGHQLRYGNADTWFLRADRWSDLAIASPDTVVGMDLTDFLPKGDDARELRRLQNEVQMAWHDHPVNAARQTRGLAPVNAFWVWGQSQGAIDPSPMLATCAVPGWLHALGSLALEWPQLTSEVLVDGRVLVVGTLAEAAIASDWSTWLAQMQALESALFAPLLDALKRGQANRLTLVLSSREALRQFSTSTMAQRAFWRRPSLGQLA